MLSMVLATCFLGASQGILTSICVIMIMDRVSAYHRGIANGVLECVIYVCLACWTFIAALIEEKAGYRPWIPYVSIAVTMIGFFISLFITDTTALVKQETEKEERELITISATSHDINHHNGILDNNNNTTAPSLPSDMSSSSSSMNTTTSITSSASPSLMMTFSHCFSRPHLLSLLLSGFSNNMRDGIAWGCFPTFYAKQHISLSSSSYLLFAYPCVWGIDADR